MMIRPKVSWRLGVAAAGTALALVTFGMPAAHADADPDDDLTQVWACDDASGTPGDPATCDQEPGPENPAVVGETTDAPEDAVDRACDYDTWYTFAHVRGSRISFFHATSNDDQVTLRVGVTKGNTLTGTIGGTGTFSISALVAEAQSQVSASLAYQKSAAYDASESWYVPKGQHLPARLDVGAQTRWSNWANHRQNTNCSITTIGSGTDNLPQDFPTFWHSS